MSQTAAQPAPPAPAPPAPGAAPTPAPTPAPATVGKRNLAEDVPSLLNRLQALAVAACLIFGVVAAAVQVLSWQANGRAADNTEQVVRVQQIQSLLLRADAIATNAFLIGGLEPPAARAQYDAVTDDVLRLIADAAEAQPADRRVLADLNVEVRSYTTAVAQARDYNRQNFPIGIAYLNNAGDSLRQEALPIVKALVDANSQRAVDEMNGQHPIWLFWGGFACVLGLWWVNRQLAKRFHRRFNVGVAAGAVVLIVLTLLTAVHAFGKSGDNDDTRAGPYQQAVDEASARTAANDAKAQESQGLINRGSGPAYEEDWAAAAEIVEKTASPARCGSGTSTSPCTSRCAGSTTTASGTARWPSPPRPRPPGRPRCSTRSTSLLSRWSPSRPPRPPTRSGRAASPPCSSWCSPCSGR